MDAPSPAPAVLDGDVPGSRGTEVLVDLRVAVGTIGLSRQDGQPAGVGAYRAARRLLEDLQVPFGVIWTADA